MIVGNDVAVAGTVVAVGGTEVAVFVDGMAVFVGVLVAGVLVAVFVGVLVAVFVVPIAAPPCQRTSEAPPQTDETCRKNLTQSQHVCPYSESSGSTGIETR